MRLFNSIPPSNTATCCAFMIGYINELKQPEKVLTEEDRAYIQTKPIGELTIKVEVRRYNFDSFGYDWSHIFIFNQSLFHYLLILLRRSKHRVASVVFNNDEYFPGDKKGFIIFYERIEVGISKFYSLFSLLFIIPMFSSRNALSWRAFANKRSSSWLIFSGKSNVSLGKNLSLFKVFK